MTNKTPIPIDELRLETKPNKHFAVCNYWNGPMYGPGCICERLHKYDVGEQARKQLLALREDLAAGRVAIVPVEPTEEMYDMIVQESPQTPEPRELWIKTVNAAAAYEFGGGG